MSNKLTRICLPGSHYGGLMDWGEQTAAEMITQIRRHAALLRLEAEEIEAAADADFKIDVVRGPLAQHHVCSIQQGRSRP